jgi:hypothetical protein
MQQLTKAFTQNMLKSQALCPKTESRLFVALPDAQGEFK